MYGLTMQCIGKTYYQMFQLSATGPNLCHQPKSSLINHIDDCLLDARPTIIQMLPQLINILHRILIDPFLQHCRDSVIYVLKSGMLESHRFRRYNRSLVSRDKAARWLCVHGVLACCTFKT